MDQQIAGLRALSITDVKPVADTETDINALPEPVRSEAKEMRAKMRGNKDRPVTWYDSVLHEERQRARDDARHKETMEKFDKLNETLGRLIAAWATKEPTK